MTDELAAGSAAFGRRHWARPRSSRSHCGPSHMELDVSQTQMLYLGGDSKGCVAWWRQPWGRLRGQLLHKGWFPGLVRLNSCGAPLLGQRTLSWLWERVPQEGVKTTKKSIIVHFGPP